MQEQNSQTTNVSATPATTSRLCACGCGQEITSKNKRVEFRPGHDATLKSRLVRLALQGDADAHTQLAQRDWLAFLEKASTKTRNHASNTTCACGCGEAVKPGSRYVPGHDSKHKSALVDQAMLGDPATREAAEALLAELGWTSFLDQRRATAERKLEEELERAQAKAEREAAKEAKHQKNLAERDARNKAKEEGKKAAQAKKNADKAKQTKPAAQPTQSTTDMATSLVDALLNPKQAEPEAE